MAGQFRALMSAAEKDHTNCARRLLTDGDVGVNKETKNKNGQTALISARLLQEI